MSDDLAERAFRLLKDISRCVNAWPFEEGSFGWRTLNELDEVVAAIHEREQGERLNERPPD